MWVVPDDATLTSGGEGVFVIEGGICDGNRDLSDCELSGAECGNLPLDPLSLFVDDIGSECLLHDRLSLKVQTVLEDSSPRYHPLQKERE